MYILSQPICDGRAWERVLAENCDQFVRMLFLCYLTLPQDMHPSLRHQSPRLKTARKYVRGRHELTRINRMFCHRNVFMGSGMNRISFMCLHCLTVGKLTELKSEYNVNAAGIL